MRLTIAFLALVIVVAGTVLTHDLYCKRVQHEFLIELMLYQVYQIKASDTTQEAKERALNECRESARKQLGHEVDFEKVKAMTPASIMAEAQVNVHWLPWFLSRERYENIYKELGIVIP